MAETDKIISTNCPNPAFPTFVRGDYVISPCSNVFNNNISYWISKKNMTVAHYCFSVTTVREAWNMLSEPSAISGFVNLFKERFKS